MPSSKVAERNAMPRAPSPTPPDPARPDDEQIELAPHFEEAKPTRKPRKQPSENPKPRKSRAKPESDQAPKEAKPRTRKSSTPRKSSDAPTPGDEHQPDPLRAHEVAAELRAPPANDIALRVQSLPPPAEVMPYHPSAPCATCATGVDPLRARCVRATARGLEFFCSRTCREQRALSERTWETRVEPPVVAPRPIATPTVSRSPSPSVPPSRPAPKSLESVARRIAPGHATTPLWPWLAVAIACGLPFVHWSGAIYAASLTLSLTAAAFAARSAATREQAGAFGWLAPSVSVAALSLAAVLTDMAQARIWLASAGGALLVNWFREHWLERAHAIVSALRAEFDARGENRVRVWSRDASGEVRMQERPLSSLHIGDHIWLEQGAVVPADGVVEEGTAELLPYPQARLTVARREGGTVLAGALLIQGTLRVRATAVGPRRALYRALSTPDRQLASVSPSAQRTARARALAPVLAVLAIAAATLTPGTLSTKLAAVGAALLVLPVLAASRGVLAALQTAVIRAGTRGVFFRDGAALERAGQVDTAVLRVEGTLVPRACTLVEVHALSDELDRDGLLAWALAVEAAADGHPIARAVRRHAATFGVEAPLARRPSYLRGAGVTGFTDGQGAVVFGSRAALLSAGVSVAVADREAQHAEQQGHKVVLLALGGHVRGLFVFAQEMRAEARLAVQSLFDLGLEVELVSGDHRNTIEALARTLDVLQLKAELSREQREAEVRRLRDGEARVVTIGSAEDAGAMLTAADVSLCLEGAPAVLTPGDLRAVAYDVITASADLCDAAHALGTAREARRALAHVWILAGIGGALALLAGFSLVPPWACALAALGIDAGCLHPRTLRARRD